MTADDSSENTPPVEPSSSIDRRLGILADPEAGPAEIAKHLIDQLAGRVAETVGDHSRWDMTIEYERLPAGTQGHTAMFNRAEAWKNEHGFDLVICVTDLPLRSGRNPVVADLSAGRGIGIVSLPAFGAIALRRRVTLVVVYLIAELLGQQPEMGGAYALGPSSFVGDRRRSRRMSRHLYMVTVDEPGIDRRVISTHRRSRLLLGMVRDNRPWRFATGMSRTVVAAFALSAFYLVSSGVWELSSTLGPARLTFGTFASLIILVAWLILRHNLWQRPRRADLRYDRGEVLLFNASTVVTLSIGVCCLYVALFAFILAAALLFVAPEVLSSYVGGNVTLSTYLNLAWMTSSVATLAGALGSGLDSEQTVRAAAYSSREQERRARWKQQVQEYERTEQVPDTKQAAADESSRAKDSQDSANR